MEPLAKPPWLEKLRGAPSTTEVTKSEVAAAQKYMDEDPGLAKNGWTAEKLAAYHKERGGSDYRPSKRKRRPTRTNGKHNPHRWRR